MIQSPTIKARINQKCNDYLEYAERNDWFYVQLRGFERVRATHQAKCVKEVRSKCIGCGAEIISKGHRKYCDTCIQLSRNERERVRRMSKKIIDQGGES